jgi:hypothetical protein
VTGVKGRTLLAAPPVGETDISSDPAGIFELAWVLTDETKLRRSRCANRSGSVAILVVALCTASTGFLAMRRSLSQERQLSEMKSNFGQLRLA